MTNTLLLKSAIVASGLTQESVASELNMTLSTFNYKLNNKSEFRASEIKKLIELLKIKSEEVKDLNKHIIQIFESNKE